MQRFEVPDYDHPERNYLTRWRLVQTPWFGVYLHRLGGPDPRPTLHDHPWTFRSLVLCGGYSEVRRDNYDGGTVRREVTRTNVMRTHDAHYIRALHRTPTWTLLLVGARRRAWGYIEDGNWTRFDLHRHNDAFLEALSVRAASTSGVAGEGETTP